MNNVLFVSEDAASAALQDGIRRSAGRWQLRFALNGAQALEAIGQSAYDIVIVELSPGQARNGLQILTQAKALQAAAARIVLTDPLEVDLLPAALEVAHQCVAKPCAPDQFWKLVERTTCMYGLMNNRVIRDLLGGLDRLPSVPGSYVALSRAMERDEPRLSEVVAVVERDTAMATKVLQLVNSAYFGRPRRISSIPVTVALLGLDRLRALALGTQVFAMVSDVESRACGLERLQDRSLATAQLARRFLSPIGRGDEGFTVGLLQDIGKLLLAACLKDRYGEVHQEAVACSVAIEAVERERFGVSSAIVGACLLSMWGLPVTIVEAVAFHSAPSGVLHDDTTLVDAAHVASALATAIVDGGDPLTCELALDPILLSRDGFAEQLQGWRALAGEEFASLISP